MSVFKQSAPKGGGMAGARPTPAMGAPLASAGGQRAQGMQAPGMGGSDTGMPGANPQLLAQLAGQRAPGSMMPMGGAGQPGAMYRPPGFRGAAMTADQAQQYQTQIVAGRQQYMNTLPAGHGINVTAPKVNINDWRVPAGGSGRPMPPRMAPTPQQIAAQEAANSRPPPVGPDGQPQQGKWSPGGNWHPARTASGIDGGPGGAAVTRPPMGGGFQDAYGGMASNPRMMGGQGMGGGDPMRQQIARLLMAR